MAESKNDAGETRRREPRADSPDRRRAKWGEFRQAYPGILWTMSIALLLILAMDIWLVVKRNRYAGEVARLRQGMTEVERKRADIAIESEENRLSVMLELMRRQAAGDRALHLSVSVDSAMMFLELEGASLRDMSVEVGPERRVGTAPDTVQMVAPRGMRTVTRLLGPNDSWEVPAWVYADRGVPVPAERSLKGALGPAAIVLDGGTVIYSMPSVGPLNDSTYVLPGAVRARAADLSAIAPNVKPGLKVYFY